VGAYDPVVVRTVAIQLLGRFSVAVDGVPISGDAWRSRRAADVVKLLALAPEHRMHRAQAMEALWPESDPEASGSNLRKALHFARRAAGSDRAIVNDRGVLALWPDARVETDVQRFEAAAQRALDGGDEDSKRVAAELYLGELLPDDRYESWSAEPRGRLLRRYLDT
jgi:DNA-binding SARP family transcriptional activator